MLAYFGLFAGIYALLAVVAVCLLRERPTHLLMVPIYRFIYEPLRAYLLYAALGMALRGVRLGWNRVARTAHVDVVASPCCPAGRPGRAAPAGRCPVRRRTVVLGAVAAVVLLAVVAVTVVRLTAGRGPGFVAAAWLPVWDDRATASLPRRWTRAVCVRSARPGPRSVPTAGSRSPPR